MRLWKMMTVFTATGWMAAAAYGVPTGGAAKPATAPKAATATVATPAAIAAPAAATATVKAAPSKVSYSNDFVSIDVNSGDRETGRFAVETVKGDASTDKDDNKVLIYGRPVPWTSYTTIRVDGVDYLFGGPSKRTGAGAQYGEIVTAPRVEGSSVVTVCRIAGLNVTQRLSIAAGPVSRLFDSVRVSYEISNPTGASHKVGVRVLLDTLLGSNDGAPFRVGTKNITDETQMSGAELPEYWIAFDNLASPGVVARGTLSGAGLVSPDRVVFANWGKLGKNPWDIAYSAGQSFMREGEGEMDSAIALYWNESEIASGGARTVATLYGIEYLNVVGGVLRLGTVPNLGEWPTARDQVRSYTVYAYVGNEADFQQKEVSVALRLPEGIKLPDGDDGVRNIGELNPKQELVVGWEVTPIPGAGGPKKLQIVGKSAQADEVTMDVAVLLLSPPGIKETLTAPDALQAIEGKGYGPQNPFAVQLRCSNPGQSPVDNLKVEIFLSNGLEFPRAQQAVQTYRRLEGGEEVVFTWRVMATGAAVGDLAYSVRITSDSADPKMVARVIHVPPIGTKMEWMNVPEKTIPGVYFPAEVFITGVKNFDRAEFNLKFDPQALEVVRVSQGTAFVAGETPMPWSDPIVDNAAGTVTGIRAGRNGAAFNGDGSLAVFHFRTRQAGKATLRVVDLKLTDAAGKPIQTAAPADAQITIVEK